MCRSLVARVLVFCCLVTLSASNECSYGDWPQFLGPSRNGTSDAQGLIDSFAKEGPDVIWQVRGGVGMSAVAISGEHAVTMWNAKGKQLLVSLDVASGKQNWSVPLHTAYMNGQGDGPRATPTIDNGIVYAFTGEGILCAVKLDSAELVWKTNTTQQLNTKPAEYGMASSPLVVGDHVIVQVGAERGTIVAYSRADGKQAWAVGSATAGYSSPVLLNVAGEQQIVCITGFGVHGLNPESGTELWNYEFKTAYDCNTASPVAVGKDLFISAGENHGCVMLSVVKNGSDYQVNERWASVDAKSVLRNEWQTSVLHDGHLFGFDNVGSAGPTTHLTCINAQTGDMVWRETRFGKGNLVLADGKLWITTMSGELILAAASKRGYKELARAKLFGKTRQTLSISNGKGIIRDNESVICLRIDK